MNGGVQKHHRYFVYSPDNSRLLKEWTDVTSDFEYTDEINTLGGDLTVKLGRSIRNKVAELGYLIDEAGDFIVDEDGGKIVTEGQATINVGPGTDVDHQNRLAVYEYYGTLDYIIDENGDYITGEDGSRLIAESGALDGRRVFNGKISKWAVEESDRGSFIVVTAVPLSVGYNDLIYENYLWQFTQNVNGPLLGQGLSAPDGVNNSAMAQTFQAPATGQYLRAVIGLDHPSATYVYGTLRVLVKLYSGNDPNGVRTLLHSDNLIVDLSIYSGRSIAWNLYFLDGPILTAGSWYHLELTTTTARITGEEPPTQVLYNNGAGYAPGTFWMKTGGSTTFTEYTGSDLYFIADVLTDRQTKVTYTNSDLYEFVDQTIDTVATRLQTVNPNNSLDGGGFVEDPAVTVPEIVLNLDTAKTRMDMAVQAAPQGWYYRYDHATNQMIFKGRRETAEHVLITGKHIKSVEVEYDADAIVNTVYFTGGLTDPSDLESSLFIRRTDPVSVAKYGPRARAISDARITNLDSAELRVQYELLLHKDPVYRTVVAVIDSVYDVSTIKVGQTIGFNGNGTFVDDLILQVMRQETFRGFVLLTLGSLPPSERKRLADLRAALDTMAVANNSISPA